MKMKTNKEIEAIVSELWQVLQKHHLPMIETIRVMRKFEKPIRTLEQSILHED